MLSKPRIVADAAIPYLNEWLHDRAELIRLPGAAINAAALSQADALLVRTVTPVTAELLHNTPVRFVGTVTAGMDHVDSENISSEIKIACAAGANANAVAEYVIAVLARLIADQRLAKRPLKIGIVGLGAVGQRVATLLTALNMQVHASDPPRAEQEPGFVSESLDSWRDFDLITLHTPLVLTGRFPTKHLIDAEFLCRQAPNAVIINTSRGEVLNHRDIGGNSLCLDVYPGEPEIDPNLVAQAYLSTPHIAGYTEEAKFAATAKIMQALAHHFEWPNWNPPPTLVTPSLTPITLTQPMHWTALVLAAFDPAHESHILKTQIAQSAPPYAAMFNHVRQTYVLRREFSAFKVQGETELLAQASLLGFNC